MFETCELSLTRQVVPCTLIKERCLSSSYRKKTRVKTSFKISGKSQVCEDAFSPLSFSSFVTGYEICRLPSRQTGRSLNFTSQLNVASELESSEEVCKHAILLPAWQTISSLSDVIRARQKVFHTVANILNLPRLESTRGLKEDRCLLFIFWCCHHVLQLLESLTSHRLHTATSRRKMQVGISVRRVHSSVDCELEAGRMIEIFPFLIDSYGRIVFCRQTSFRDVSLLSSCLSIAASQASLIRFVILF